MPYTSIDLFAGCGGLSLGLHYAGWEGIFAVERDAMAFETLSRNMIDSTAAYSNYTAWPAWLEKTNLDIAKVLDNQQSRRELRALNGTVDLIVGGPPCQGFSVGGRRDGADERNKLVFKMLELVELVRPRAVLIENVEGIARRFVAKPGHSQSAPVAELVIQEFERLGYVGTYTVVSAVDFGVPQTRRRVAILAVRDANGLSSASLKRLFERSLANAATRVRNYHGLPLNRPTTVGEALEDLWGGTHLTCPDSPEFESSVYKTAKSAYAKFMRRGIRTGKIPDSHRYSKHGERIQALYNLAHETQPPGRLSKEFLLENGTKKDKKALLDAAMPSSTITTHPDEFIHFAEPRNITVREMARLQSFPDDFRFYGRYTINGPRRKHDVARCSQVGNAVPPMLGQGLGLAVQTVLETLTDMDAFEELLATAPYAEAEAQANLALF
ncbi:DNA cytosine methyltransferase [Burkholderia sp. Tr-20390]|uniref:DNA cytosine methyltransferase n=1 Tax=Burkholderia sp. Tr-20390 TaxID=2703904 RepID=UPI0019821D56|nr:DNA cytosine methyltransferase [Burkholderia sp. Tr-20390]MBN3735408.1 DNA cytosine methyltransferase [Burkholderia sp. Tr-20390]